MRNTMRYAAIAATMAVLGGCATGQMGGAENMTFFVTSTNPGKGGDLGGIDGADRHCQALASAAGAGTRNWRAYLSTQGSALNDPKVMETFRSRGFEVVAGTPEAFAAFLTQESEVSGALVREAGIKPE